MTESEATNCPSCGAGVASDWPNCRHCGVRLATMACPSCFGMMLLGSKFCPHCAAVAVEWRPDAAEAKCPHCTGEMFGGSVGTTTVHECSRCFGLWLDRTSFDAVCRDRERQASLLAERPQAELGQGGGLEPVRYRTCPVCIQLMNRVNYAGCSGVIIDVCPAHGVWFDRDELQRIVAFLQSGGMDRARKREMENLARERSRLREVQRSTPMPHHSFGYGADDVAIGGLLEIGGFVFRSLFD
jgi:Zn-finger nucleic acid-binding protein